MHRISPNQFRCQKKKYSSDSPHRGRKRPIHSSSSREIYSRIWSAALFPVTPPPPRVKDMQTVCGWEGLGGVESCWRPYSEGVLYSISDQIQNIQNCYSPKEKNLEGEGAGPQTDNQLPQSLFVWSLLRRRNFALPSTSLIFLRLECYTLVPRRLFIPALQ